MSRLFLAALMLAPTTAIAQSVVDSYEQDMGQLVPTQSDDWTIRMKVLDPYYAPGNGGSIDLIAEMPVVPKARVIAVPHRDFVAIEITTPTDIWDFEVWNQACTGFKGEATFAYDEETRVAWLIFDDTDGVESMSMINKPTYDWASKCLMGEAPPDAE